MQVQFHNFLFLFRDLKCENILLDEQGFVKLTGTQAPLASSPSSYKVVKRHWLDDGFVAWCCVWYVCVHVSVYAVCICVCVLPPDFGFANHSSDRRALMNTFCGSVAYTAPEILLSRKYNGEQADLWSL